MRGDSQRPRVLRSALVLVIAFSAYVAGPPARADVENGNLPGGTSITVEIATPADGGLIASPPGDVSLTGSASVGEGEPVPNTTLVYTLDVSGSTDGDSPLVGCGGDQDGDGESDSILDCEIAAALALNQEAIDAGTVDEVAVTVFASGGAVGDVGPIPFDQTTTAPTTDTNLMDGPDVEEVLHSAFSEFGGDGGLTKFSARNVGVQTNFEAGVQASCSAVQASTNPNNIVVFMSDGVSTEGGNALDDVPCAGTTARFETFAIGSEADCDTDEGGRGSLREIAEETGGECHEVEDVSQLPAVVPGVIDSELTQLTLTIDGGAPDDISSSASPSLPQTGPASVDYSLTVPGLAPGIHTLCVTAHGSDGGGQGSVTDCHDVTVATIILEPPTSTNELGPGATHTVTATVAAGSDGGVEGVDVTFEVTDDGPNEGATGSGTTDSNGEASFTYPAKQGPEGLGKDTIEACFTDDQDTETCATAEKDWVDTTPPEVACTETTNPHGENIPPAGSTTLPGSKGGQNEDGFYELNAKDAVDPNPQVFVRDTGSGTIFGPFASGTRIKYTQAPGAKPSQKKMGGPGSEVEWHITGKGDAAVFAVDASGNQSADSSCKVPPPPK